MKRFLWFTVIGLVLFMVFVLLSLFEKISPVFMLAELFVVLIVLVAGSVCIRLNFYLHSINQFTPNNRQVALTFDDGPDQHTEEILKILKKTESHATFFLIGHKIEKSKAIVQRIDAEGHTIGCHSFYHKNSFPLQRVSRMTEEMVNTNARVYSLTGKTPHYFRPPFGVTNPNVKKALQRTSMQSVGWSLRSLDTQTKNGEKLLKKLKRKTRSGQIVLLHDTQQVTVSVLRNYIDFLKKQGYQMVSLQQVLNK